MFFLDGDIFIGDLEGNIFIWGWSVLDFKILGRGGVKEIYGIVV